MNNSNYSSNFFVLNLKKKKNLNIVEIIINYIKTINTNIQKGITKVI